MVVDTTTLEDLAIFSKTEQHSVFHHFDYTRTSDGSHQLRQLFAKPLSSIVHINNRQATIRRIATCIEQWPMQITNGTVMVLDKYLHSPVINLPSPVNAVSSFGYRLLNRTDYSMVRYTVKYFVEFIQGLQKLYNLLFDDKLPDTEYRSALEKIQLTLQQNDLQNILTIKKTDKISPVTVLQIGNYIGRKKQEITQLIHIHGRLDAWYSLAKASTLSGYSFPEFIAQENGPKFKANQLFHPLLHNAVAYDYEMNRQHNFVFLTGANMAGKSTFIKAIGITAYLAHLGIAVPAESLQISLLDGIFSNIQVSDNILQGESYFFNEVQRIRQTVHKIKSQKYWLVLIDELFKGTNVQDAMRCSKAVIEGLRKVTHSFFILSTHLYEIADELKDFSNILFQYFETNVENHQLSFSYQLKSGVSNDRIGYLILEREGVIKELDTL